MVGSMASKARSRRQSSSHATPSKHGAGHKVSAGTKPAADVANVARPGHPTRTPAVSSTTRGRPKDANVRSTGGLTVPASSIANVKPSDQKSSGKFVSPKRLATNIMSVKSKSASTHKSASTKSSSSKSGSSKSPTRKLTAQASKVTTAKLANTKSSTGKSTKPTSSPTSSPISARPVSSIGKGVANRVPTAKLHSENSNSGKSTSGKSSADKSASDKSSSMKLDLSKPSPGKPSAPTAFQRAVKSLNAFTDFEKLRIVRYNTDNFDLSRMRSLLRRIGNPHEHIRTVHIAGTKGKGSTAAMVAHMLEAQGYKVGIYSSPHLIDVRERISILGGQPTTTLGAPQTTSSVEGSSTVQNATIVPAIVTGNASGGTTQMMPTSSTGFASGGAFGNALGTLPTIMGGTLNQASSLINQPGVGGGPFAPGAAQSSTASLARLISEEDFVKLVKLIEPIAKKMKPMPSWFDVMTAIAFKYFADQKVDIAIIETGLGGRLDSTNVIKPEVAAITSVSFDHMQQLGHTLARIATEKAGIFKPGVPAVTVTQVPEVEGVLKRVAAEVGAPLDVCGSSIEFSYRFEASRLGGRQYRVCLTTSNSHFEHITVPLFGEHQAINCGLAMAIIDKLKTRGLPIDDQKAMEGLARTTLQGRMELLTSKPRILVDAAHNAASVDAFMRAVGQHVPYDSMVLIFGCCGDKDIEGMLGRITGGADKVIFTRVNSIRSANPHELAARYVEQYGKMAQVADTLEDALAIAYRAVTKEDIICITGSFYLVGEAKQKLASLEPIFFPGGMPAN